jgi:hypothetical protein
MQPNCAGGKKLQALGQASVKLTVLALDVTNAEACAAVIDSIVEEHGRIDVLVNNAGIGGSLLSLEVGPTRPTTLAPSVWRVATLCRDIGRCGWISHWSEYRLQCTVGRGRAGGTWCLGGRPCHRCVCVHDAAATLPSLFPALTRVRTARVALAGHAD